MRSCGETSRRRGRLPRYRRMCRICGVRSILAARPGPRRGCWSASPPGTGWWSAPGTWMRPGLQRWRKRVTSCCRCTGQLPPPGCCARGWRCGGGRRWPRWPMRRSPRPSGTGWRSCGWPRWKTAWPLTWTWAATPPRWPSWRSWPAATGSGSGCTGCGCWRCTGRAGRLRRCRRLPRRAARWPKSWASTRAGGCGSWRPASCTRTPGWTGRRHRRRISLVRQVLRPADQPGRPARCGRPRSREAPRPPPMSWSGGMISSLRWMGSWPTRGAGAAG